MVRHSNIYSGSCGLTGREARPMKFHTKKSHHSQHRAERPWASFAHVPVGMSSGPPDLLLNRSTIQSISVPCSWRPFQSVHSALLVLVEVLRGLASLEIQNASEDLIPSSISFGSTLYYFSSWTRRGSISNRCRRFGSLPSSLDCPWKAGSTGSQLQHYCS